MQKLQPSKAERRVQKLILLGTIASVLLAILILMLPVIGGLIGQAVGGEAGAYAGIAVGIAVFAGMVAILSTGKPMWFRVIDSFIDRFGP